VTGPTSKALFLPFLMSCALGVSACTTRSSCSAAIASSEPLCIDTISASVGADGQTISVAIGVTSNSDNAERGKVWWVLSPPAEQPAWQHDIYHSAVYSFAVGPRGKGVVQWTEEVLIPDGFYDFSSWIHVKDASGQFVHSSGRAAAAVYLTTGSNRPTLLRHSQPTGSVAIKGAMNKIQEGSCPAVHSAVRLENASNDKQTVGFAWGLIPLTGRFPRWWEGPAVLSGDRQELTLGSRERFDAEIDRVLPPNVQLEAGRYGMRIALDSNGAAEDMALVGQSWTSSGNKVSSDLRTFQPSGSVMIGALDAPKSAVQHQKFIASVELCNLTSQRQVAKVWWILGRVGDLTPWQHPVAMSQPLRVNLLPWGDATVAPTAFPVGANGRYALSAWVHVRAATGKFVHSDGLWLTEPVLLNAEPAS
jgi:hypothetical protein